VLRSSTLGSVYSTRPQLTCVVAAQMSEPAVAARHAAADSPNAGSQSAAGLEEQVSRLEVLVMDLSSRVDTLEGGCRQALFALVCCAVHVCVVRFVGLLIIKHRRMLCDVNRSENFYVVIFCSGPKSHRKAAGPGAAMKSAGRKRTRGVPCWRSRFTGAHVLRLPPSPRTFSTC